MTKTSQDNNHNYTNFLQHFYEYHTEKLKYRGVQCFYSKGFDMINLLISLGL